MTIITKSELTVRCNKVAAIPEETVGLLWLVGEAVAALLAQDAKASERSLVKDCGVSQSSVNRGHRLFKAFPQGEVECRRAFRLSEAGDVKAFLVSLDVKPEAAPAKKVSASKKAAASIERTLKGLTAAQQRAALVQVAKDLGITL